MKSYGNNQLLSLYDEKLDFQTNSLSRYIIE
jgi:hypothetical protein